jgi:ABC-type nitrate/sulfonate/bicarbonate transport system substrate-binding protein
VPGSENRVAGLINDQLDAAPIDAQNTALLMQQVPGEFAVIDSFAESSKLLASVFYARSDWLAENSQAVKDFAAAYNEVIQAAYEDPAPFLASLKETLPDADPVILEEVLNGWLERRVWNPVGGVQPDTIQAAIDFYSSARAYERITGPDVVSTTEFVEGLPE